MKTTVLITRALDQAEPLLHYLQSNGIQTHCLPTLIIEPLPFAIIHTQLASSFSCYQYVIAVSTNAVKYGVLPHLDLLSQHYFIAVGPSTARLLRELGITKVLLPAQADSEGVLALPELQSVEGATILLLAGEDGRELLEEVLTQRGAHVKKLAVYQRVCPPGISAAELAPLQSLSLNWIVIMSGTSLTNLIRMVGEAGQAWLRQQKLLVVSARLQQQALSYGWQGEIHVATGATPEAILAALRNRGA